MKKGQTLLSVVLWASGMAVSVGGLVYGATSTRFSEVNKTIDTVRVSATIQGQDIASLKAKVERLPIIENKLDALLQSSGINPKRY